MTLNLDVVFNYFQHFQMKFCSEFQFTSTLFFSISQHFWVSLYTTKYFLSTISTKFLMSHLPHPDYRSTRIIGRGGGIKFHNPCGHGNWCERLTTMVALSWICAKVPIPVEYTLSKKLKSISLMKLEQFLMTNDMAIDVIDYGCSFLNLGLKVLWKLITLQ